MKFDIGDWLMIPCVALYEFVSAVHLKTNKIDKISSAVLIAKDAERQILTFEFTIQNVIEKKVKFSSPQLTIA